MMDNEDVMDLEHWLDEYGQAVVDAMYPDENAPEHFQVSPLVRRSDRLVIKVASDDRAALVKAFEIAGKTHVQRTDREMLVLLALRDTALIPEIRSYNQSQNWVLTEWIEGTVLEHVITAENAAHYATEMGRWFADYTRVMETHGGTRASNWYDYLQSYPALTSHVDFAEHRDMLSDLAIKTRLIAKNDAFFGNFMVAEDGRLVGIDFEKSQLKPYGWDIMVTARILVRRFPLMFHEVTEAIVTGWGQGTDCMDKATFLELTRLFAASSAFVVEEDYAIAKAKEKNDQFEDPVSGL